MVMKFWCRSKMWTSRILHSSYTKCWKISLRKSVFWNKLAFCTTQVHKYVLGRHAWLKINITHDILCANQYSKDACFHHFKAESVFRCAVRDEHRTTLQLSLHPQFMTERGLHQQVYRHPRGCECWENGVFCREILALECAICKMSVTRSFTDLLYQWNVNSESATISTENMQHCIHLLRLTALKFLWNMSSI